MVRYSDNLIEEVRAGNDIVDVIGDLVLLKRAGNNYTGLCPFHNEKTASFSVNRQKQMYYCFGCHAGGNVITFLMEYHHMSFPEAMEALAERAGITLPKVERSAGEKENEEKRQSLYEIYKKAATYYYMLLKSSEGARARQYLSSRNLSEETLKKWGLGYSGLSGKLYPYLKKEGYSDTLLSQSGLFRMEEKSGALDLFWNRVMFPIQDARGRVIGFGGRVMGEALPKYLNSPETELFNKRLHLYGLHYARATRRNYMILCEGYLDVIALHAAGVDCACASLGTALTAQQASLLRRYTQDVILLYDSDDAGRHASLRAIPLLKDAGISVRVGTLSPCKDPDEFLAKYSVEELEQRLSSSQSAFMFELSELERGYDLKDPQDATAFQHALAAKLAAIAEDLERENYLFAVARNYRLSEDALKKLVRTVALSGTDHVRTQPKSLRMRAADPDSAASRIERRMLSYLAHYPDAYPQIRDFISFEDYEDPVCRKLSEHLYPMLEHDTLSPATLISLFEDPEEQRNAAEILQGVPPADTAKKLDRDFTDTFLKLAGQINTRKLREGTSDPDDVGTFMRLTDVKKKLETYKSGESMLHLKQQGEGEEI